jgi:hypothetical protein
LKNNVKNQMVRVVRVDLSKLRVGKKNRLRKKCWGAGYTKNSYTEFFCTLALTTLTVVKTRYLLAGYSGQGRKIDPDHTLTTPTTTGPADNRVRRCGIPRGPASEKLYLYFISI